MREHPRVSLDDPPPTPECFCLRPQPFVLVADPAYQVGIDTLQERIHRRPVERAVVVHPTTDDRVDVPRHIDEVSASAVVQPPGPHLRTDLLQGWLTDRGIERAKLLPILAPRPALPEREPQERELGVLVRGTPPSVLAVHNPGFVGMQPQPDLLHPLRDRRQHLACTGFADAVHHRVIHVPFERHGRELPGHPRIERIMEEQISQHRRHR